MSHIAIIVPQSLPNYVKLVAEKLNEQGFETLNYCWRDVDVEQVFNAKQNPTIVIADAENCPAFMQNQVSEYLRSGGNVVTLGGPPFTNEFYSINNDDVDITAMKWMMAMGEFDKTVILPLNSPADLEGFIKDSYNPDSKAYEGDATLSLIDGGFVSSRCVRYHTMDFYINESFEKKITIKEGHNVIGFYAKSAANTRTVTVKLVQDNGDMFKLTLCPTTSFDYYIFSRRDFTYAGNRNGMPYSYRPEYVDFSKVTAIQFGHALSHAYSVAGEHSFCIEELSSASIALLNDRKAEIDGLYPACKFYPVRNAVTVKTYSKQAFVAQREMVVPSDLFSHSPRAQATGLDKGRRSRFVPLVECLDEKGMRCGFAAFMIMQVSIGKLHSTNETGSIIAFTTADHNFYVQGGADAVAEAITALYHPALLVEGGTNEYIYQPGQQACIGAVAEIRDSTADIRLRISYANAALVYTLDDLKFVANRNYFDIRRVVADFKPIDCTVTVELLCGDKLLDMLTHDVTVYHEKPESERHFAHIKLGTNEVWIGDQPVRFYGVNYMPSANAGMALREEFEHYVAGYAYDPDIIEEDLKRVCDIGLNALSIFMHYDPSINSNNILHLVNCCTKLGLYVDLSIRPHANPFEFNEGEVREMIERYRFQNNDTVVAYDIAWERYVGTYEPCYGNFAGRKSFDKAWGQFIVNRYGSVAAAEKSWGCAVEFTPTGEVRGPTDDQLRGIDVTEEQLRMIAAYRRFIDNIVATTHHKAMQFIKGIDPNHLISPRTGDASTIPLVDPGIYGYDYKALSSSMDFMSPESYALSDSYKCMRQGVFTNVYARYANPSNVIQWKEFGKSIWTGSNFTDNSVSEGFQAEYYRRFFDMLIAGHTSGLYAWWWAGGYRYGEHSDFGIIAPDGSDRPVTKVFREYRDRFLNQPMLTHENTHKIKINRDLYADGLLSMYQSIEDELFSHLEGGDEVELVDDAVGTTTEDVPLTEIGNAEPQGYISMYLDYIITDITATTPLGREVSLVNYKSILLGTQIKITLLNTEKTVWSAHGFGSVELADEEGTLIVPIKWDVPSLGSYTFEVTAEYTGRFCLRLWAKGRTDFGERIIFTVI